MIVLSEHPDLERWCAEHIDSALSGDALLAIIDRIVAAERSACSGTRERYVPQRKAPIYSRADQELARRIWDAGSPYMLSSDDRDRGQYLGFIISGMPSNLCNDVQHGHGVAREPDCDCSGNQVCETCNPDLMAKFLDDPLQGADRRR